MSEPDKLTTQQVGKCGELLVQYELLKQRIESAPMTTDYGIDLVAIDPNTHKTVTIQVKASTHHVGDGSSKWVEWNMPENASPATSLSSTSSAT